MPEYDYVSRIAKKVLENDGIARNVKPIEHPKLEMVDPQSIKPNSYNPNRQEEEDFELLLRSMKEDGFTVPILVHRESREIVDGEHRWHASQALGYTQIPVIFVDYTREQMKIATLRHNRARGHEEMDLTAKILKDLHDSGNMDWAQTSLMISDDELNMLLAEANSHASAAAELASSNFSEAWVPSAVGQDVLNAMSNSDTAVTGVTVGGQGGTLMASTPEAAAERMRNEEALKSAKTYEEREDLRRQIDAETYKVNLFYSKDEAVMVRAVLGPTPAIKILEMCALYHKDQMDAALVQHKERLTTQEERRKRKEEAAKWPPPGQDQTDLSDFGGLFG